jgi:sugar phosphate isomerase/epimerase
VKKLAVAVQLYSVRDVLEKDFFGVLAKVRDMGYAGVEFAGYYGHSAAEIVKALKKLGMAAVSAHVALDALAKDTTGAIAFHKELGTKYLAIPWLDEASRPGTPRWPEVVATIRKIAEGFQAEGIQLLYHNHDFEFVKLGGEYALDALYKAIPMPYLATEIDTCWVRVAGVDPAAYLRRYAGRSPVVHLKDFTSGAAAAGKPLYALIDNEGKDGTVDVVDKSAFDFRPLGMGQLDVPAVLKAAEDAGASWVVVEQDRSTERPSLEAIRLSREYLAKLGL